MSLQTAANIRLKKGKDMISRSSFSIISLLTFALLISSELFGDCCYNLFASRLTGPSTVVSNVLFLNDGCLALTNGVNGTGAGGISTFSYDTTTCAFAPVANNYANGFTALFHSLAFLPACNRLLAIDFATSQMRVFNVSNCQLTEVLPSIPVTGTPRSIAVSSDASCVAVNSNNALQLFCVDPISCAITLCDTLAFPGANITNVAFAPLSSGCNFLVLTTQTNTIIQIPYTPSTCTLGMPQTIVIPGASSTFSLDFAPNGNCLAVSDSVISSAYIFGIDALCNLTHLQTINSGGTQARSLAYSKDNSCLAIANFTTSNVTIFPVNADCTVGAASQVLPSGLPFSVAFSPNPNGCNLLAVGFASSTNVPFNLQIFQACPAPLLTITKSCPKFICSKGNATYVISVTNSGNADATQVVVTDIVPDCLSITDAFGSGWNISTVGQTVTAVLSTLNPGVTASFEITTNAHCCPKQIINNQASVVSNEITTPIQTTCSSKIV